MRVSGTEGTSQGGMPLIGGSSTKNNDINTENLHQSFYRDNGRQIGSSSNQSGRGQILPDIVGG